MKKITTIIIVIVIVGAVYWLLRPAQPLSEPEQVSEDEISNLLENLEQETGINFSEVQDVEFKWIVNVDPQIKEETVSGKGFEANVIPSEQFDKIHPFLIDNGFKTNVYNLAAGTISGLTGYIKNKTVCTVAGGATGYQTATGQWIAPEPDKNDIEVKCGELEYDSYTIEAKMGDMFSIVLDANPTTGYQWEVEFDSDNIQLIDREYVTSSKEPLPGTGGYETFNFFALKPGNTNIKFSYLRSWVGDAIETLAYEIIIR